MSYHDQDYERLSESLETSGEILYAIEQITGGVFERNDDDDREELVGNATFDLWNDGGRTAEILAALPADGAEEGDEVFWGFEGLFAEFDGEKWIKDENF
jgi:hypothetical protein